MAWLTYYFAIEPGVFKLCLDNGVNFDALISLAYLKKRNDLEDLHAIIKKQRAAGHKFMLDSGGFTNFQQPGTISMEAYMEYVSANKDVWNEVVTLDDLGSRKNTISAFRYIKRQGINALFVDHVRLAETPEVEKIWKAEPKLCLSSWGTLVKPDGPQLAREVNASSEMVKRAERGRKVNTKVHLLAISSLLKFLPHLDIVSSVDSASWTRSCGFGKMLVRQTKDIGGITIPYLKSYDAPFSRSGGAPAPPDVLKRLKAFKNSKRWTTDKERRIVEFFAINEIQQYVSELNSMKPESIVAAFKRYKSEAGSIKKAYSFLNIEDIAGADPWDAGGFDEVVEAEIAIEKAQQLLAKAEAPKDTGLLEYPTPKNSQRKAVAQLHFRGRTGHLDLRVQAGSNYLIGWTIAAQKPDAIASVETLQQAKELAGSFDPAGSKWNKPLVAPMKLFATPKRRHPTVWLNLKDQVVKPGQTGATAMEPGVFTVLEHFNVEYGMQKQEFHEYFAEGSKYFNGILYFREIKRPEGSSWAFWKSKELLPTVLTKGQVDSGAMPPDGYSAMPLSLMEQTPEEYRFWTKAGAEAKKLRDELVASKYFTPENVKLVDGKIKRVEQKADAAKDISEDVKLEAWQKLREELVGTWKEEPEQNVKKLRAFLGEIRQAEDRRLRIVQNYLVGTAFRTGAIQHPAIDKLLKEVQEELERRKEKTEKFEHETVLLPIEKQQEEERIAFGIVLEPETQDSQGDKISDAEIREAAHKWLAKFQDRGFMHEKIINGKIEIYESYIAPVDFAVGGTKVKKGTWLLMYHILDDALWADIKSGKLTGFSIGGFARRVKDPK